MSCNTPFTTKSVPLLLWRFVKNSIIDWKDDMHYFLIKVRNGADWHIFIIYMAPTIEFKYMLNFCSSHPVTLCLTQNSIKPPTMRIYIGNIPNVYVFRRWNIEIICGNQYINKNKSSMNIIYFPRRRVVYETAVFIKCKLLTIMYLSIW